MGKKSKIESRPDYYLYITYSEQSHYNREPDPTDRWDAGELTKEYYMGSVYTTNPERIHFDTVRVDFDPNQLIGKTVYIVLVRYSTGSTFGRINGEHCIEAICLTETEANKIKSDIENFKRNGDWTGNFERLEYVEVRAEVVNLTL